jgi:uncharacterized membrane protein SpoIIM required for sporulation
MVFRLPLIFLPGADRAASPGPSMNPDELYQSRKADWQALTALIERSRNSLPSLTPEEVLQLGRLYRAATSDLALAQRDFPNHRVSQYLNNLVAQAHPVIYRSQPAALRRLKEFAVSGFPRTFRESLPFFLTAMLLLLVPAVLAGFTVALRPESASWLLPPGVQSLIPALENKELWTQIPVQQRPYASSFIMQNNIQVAFLAFGAGLLGGIVTVWILAFNGLFLGGLLGLTAAYGVGFELATFVIGHGVIELTVIFIAGGAGLMLGWAVLQPGLLRRRDAVTLAAHKAVRLVMGGVPLLVIAGLIEGFISPADGLPWVMKWLVGIGSGIGLYSYLFLSGQEKDTGL